MPPAPDNPGKCIVQVFARAPVPGAVKTRLIPALGARDAARLQARLTRLTLERVCAAALGPVELWCTPDTAHPFFGACGRDYPVRLQRQSDDGDLGERMREALQQGLDAGAEAVLLVGTDCPARSPAELQAAYAALRAGAALVLGPVRDGGYTLIGVRRTVPDVFTGMPWGNAQLLKRTRSRAAALGVHWFELPPSRDVDRPEDLEDLTAQPELRALLAGLGREPVTARH